MILTAGRPRAGADVRAGRRLLARAGWRWTGQDGVYATELLLERALAKGDLHPYELLVELAAPDDDTLARPLRRAAAVGAAGLGAVRPGPRARPRGALHDPGDHEDSEKLDLGGGATRDALARGFGPGILGHPLGLVSAASRDFGRPATTVGPCE